MLSFSGTLTRDATAALQLRFTLESALSQLTNLTSEADALNLEIRALRRVHANSSDGGVDSDEHDLFVRVARKSRNVQAHARKVEALLEHEINPTRGHKRKNVTTCANGNPRWSVGECACAPAGWGQPIGPIAFPSRDDSLREVLLNVSLVREHLVPPRVNNWRELAYGRPYPQAEYADVPSARTLWSVSGWRALAWLDLHHQFISEARGHIPSSNRSLLILGDSMVESMRGTSYGCAASRAADVPATVRSALASRRHSYLFGIDGEQTQHLLWRLMDGELAQSMVDDPQLDVLLMIGTNNLGVGHSSLETVKGVLAVVRYLLTYTKSANIIVGALLPRFGGTHMRHFGSSALKETNHAIANGVAQMQGASEQGRARFVDCSSSLVSTSNAETHARYNVDGVHPSARGYAALLECLA